MEDPDQRIKRAAATTGVGLCIFALFAAWTFAPLDEGALAPGAAQGATLDQVQSPTEVMHFWNAGSERAALAVVQRAFEARHGVWVDNAQPSNPELRRALMDRLSTGTPPVAVLWQSNIELRDLAELGLFTNLDDVAARENWDEILAQSVQDRVQVDGHYYMAPTNIHGLNWIFYNHDVLERLGLPEPRSWEDVMHAMDVARRNGVRPVAVGPGDWEGQMAFNAIFLGALGREDYHRYVSLHDNSVLDKPGALRALEIFAAMRDQTRRYRAYDSWALASQAVVRGDALFQFMGDWAKGEMRRAGGVIGGNVHCMLAPGSENAFALTIDGFVFPADAGATRQAQRSALASVILSRDVQREFAVNKGTLAARADAAPAAPDMCEAIMIERLRDTAGTLQPINAGLNSADAGDFQTVIVQLYRDPRFTPAQALEGLRAVIRDN